MEKRPDLPDTDDPFALLGIDDGASEKDIKRAYVRLIKVYRPERDPEAFQRIQAAYEAITEGAWLFRAAGPHLETSGDEAAASEPENWPDKVDGDERAAENGEPDRDDAELDADDWRPEAPGYPLLDEIDALLERGDLAAVTSRARDIDASLPEIIDPHTELRLVRIACAVIWFRPGLAKEIYQRAGGSPGPDGGFLHGLYDDLQAAVGRGLTLWRPPPLSRLLAVAPLIDDTAAICRDMYGDFYRDSAGYSQALGQIARMPEVFRVVVNALDWLELDEPGTEPNPYLDAPIHWVNNRIRGNRRWFTVGPGAAFTLLLSLSLADDIGVWALIIGLAIFGILVLLGYRQKTRRAMTLDDETYVSQVRPWLLDVVFRYQVSPEQIAARIAMLPKKGNAVAPYIELIRRDPEAYLVWQLIAAGRAAQSPDTGDD